LGSTVSQPTVLFTCGSCIVGCDLLLQLWYYHDLPVFDSCHLSADQSVSVLQIIGHTLSYLQ